MSLSASSSSSTGTPFGEDTSSPFHLPSGDNPGLVLVAQPLTEENYNTWSRSVIVALNAKNKVGFIDGSITEPKDSSHPTYSSWKKCNNMVLSWLKVEIRIMVPKLAVANNVSTAIEELLQWRMIGLGEKLGGLYVFQNSSHIAVPRNILTLLSKFQSQDWTYETVEYEMDLVDSAVKSLKSLSNERWERLHDKLSKVVSAFGYQKRRFLITFIKRML